MKSWIQLPILDWIKTYDKSFFKDDLGAGLTVGIILIPQGMAYAMIAGLEPIHGLYAAIFPLVLYAILGTARQLAVGPVAMDSLIVAAGVSAIAEQGTENYLALATLLALMVGVIQFILGIFRLGFIVNFLSRPVISGFTSAAALMIASSQLKHLLGVNLPQSNFIHEVIMNVIQNIQNVHWITVGVGLGGILIIILLKKYVKKIPAALMVVIVGIVVVWQMNLATQGLKIVGSVPSGLPQFSLPQISANNIVELFPIAITLALIGFMETIAIGKGVQSKHRNYKILPNQELIALSFANISASLSQAYPVTGSFSRTAINDQEGAKTGIASIISAIVVVLTLLFLTPLFYYLPKAVLASIIMVSVFGLIDIKEAKFLWKTDRVDFWMLFATFLGTLLLGIDKGILIGVVLSVVMMIYQTTQPHIAVLGKIPEEPYYRNINRFGNLEERSNALIVRFDARLYFANVNYFKDSLENLIQAKGSDLELLIIDAECINGIDSSGTQAVEELHILCSNLGIRLCFVSVKGPIRDIFQRTGLFEVIGQQNFFMSTHDAITCFDNQNAQPLKDYIFQSNSRKRKH